MNCPNSPLMPLTMASYNQATINQLHLAIDRCNTRKVQSLLQHGSSPDALNEKPIETSSDVPQVPATHLVKLRREGFVGCLHLKPLHRAATLGRQEIAALLLQHGADIDSDSEDGKSALMRASATGQLQLVRMLLEHDACVTIRDQSNSSALCYAVSFGHSEIVSLLLDRGADMDAPGNQKCTPLQLALSGANEFCLAKYEEIVRLLLKRGARTDSVAVGGHSLIHTAMLAGKYYYISLVDLLLQHAAPVNIADDKYMFTPLHHAAKSGYADIAIALLQNGASTEAVDTVHETPLHVALRYGNFNIVSLLIQFGANVDALKRNEVTPLMYAAEHGRDREVTFLLDHGASLMSLDRMKNTALHHAALAGHHSCAAILVERGVDVSARNYSKETALDIAVGHTNIEDLLRAKVCQSLTRSPSEGFVLL